MKKLLVVLAFLGGIVLSGCVRANDMAERVIFTFGWDNSESYYCMRTYTLDGVFVSSFECEEHPEDTCMAVDEDDNVYYVDAAIGYNIIRKRDRDGTLLLSKATTYSTRLCMSPDGYVCELGLTTDFDLAIIRRDPDTLDVVDQMITADQDSGHYEGFTCDSEGYFYWIKRNTHLLEKWDFDLGIMVASHSVLWSTITRIAVVGSVIAFNSGYYIYTIPTSLDEDATQHSLADFSSPKAVASIGDLAFIIGGYDSVSKKYVVGKYTSGLAKLWVTKDIPYEDNLYGVAAYPVLDKEAPWDEDILEPTGEVKVEIPRRSGEWTTLEDVMRIHTSNGKDTSSPRAPIEIGQAEVMCSNISKNFNSFEEASYWYKNLEGYATQISLGCNIGGSPISVKLFTGIIKNVHPHRLSQTAEIKVIDFLDYFGRVTIKETPVWENISLTQLFKNLVELAFPEWTEGVDYFVEDLGGSTIPAIGYTDLNLLSELKMIAESRGKRLYTDVDGRLHCASRNPEREPLTVSYNYNLEDVKERRDINSILNWIVVHATPYEIKPDLEAPGKISGFTATPGDQKIDLTWNNPTDDDFVKVLIHYSTTHYPLNRDDGTKIYEGTGQSKEHTGLTNGTKYYYSAWTVDDKDNWSGAAHTAATPAVAAPDRETWVDDSPPSRVTQFTATPEHSKIILTWYNPKIANFDKVVIRRSTSSYPDSPTSGSAEYDGTAETHEDTGLTNGIRYYYSAFAKNTVGDYSGAAFASAIPAGPRKVLSTKIISGGKYAGPGGPGTYFSNYTKKVRLSFATGGRTQGWLRFRHRWDVQTTAGPRYPSNQGHAVGLADDLSLSFGKNVRIASITVSLVSCSAKTLVVDYTLTLTVRVLKIRFRNTLSLMG